MLVLFFLLFPLNLSAFPYVCIIEDSVGFSKNDGTKTWERTNFNNREKYLVSKSKNKKFIAIVKEFGKSEIFLNCGSFANDDEKSDTNYLFKYGELMCHSGAKHTPHIAKINIETLEIIVSSYGGIGIAGGYGSDFSAFMSIGSCSPL
jgi:hypothetical protein